MVVGPEPSLEGGKEREESMVRFQIHIADLLNFFFKEITETILRTPEVWWS